MAKYNLCECGSKKVWTAQVCLECRKKERKTDHTKSCYNCGELTSNPKYCSKSCSVASNNSINPKRGKLPCTKCGKERTGEGRTRCLECASDKIRNYNSWTLRDMRGKSGNANNSRYTYIRHLSRRSYLASDKPKKCLECGYTLHFDVAHIKDVKSYPEEATVSEVNHLDNLIALCKNHHWEFDNGYLEIEGVCSGTKPKHP